MNNVEDLVYIDLSTLLKLRSKQVFEDLDEDDAKKLSELEDTYDGYIDLAPDVLKWLYKVKYSELMTDDKIIKKFKLTKDELIDIEAVLIVYFATKLKKEFGL